MANRVDIIVGIDSSSVTAEIRGLEGEVDRFAITVQRGGSAGQQATQSMLPGISAVQAAWGLAGAAVIKFGKDVLQAASEGASANRQLMSTATGAGVVYREAAAGAKELGDALAISNTDAQKTYSQLLTLTKNAGLTKETRNIAKEFADVAAARGLQTSEIADLAQQLSSGQDDALNRIGIKDPGALYKDYADSIHKAATALSDEEKAQARVNAVRKLGAENAGAAADRLQSVDGQLARVNKGLDDLYSNLGAAAAGNMEFMNFLGTLNDLLKAISTNAEDVKKKLADGLTPKQIAEQQAGSGFNRTMDYVSAGATQIAFGPINPVGHLVARIAGFSAEDIARAGSPEAIHQRRIEQLRQQAEATKRDLDRQEKQAAENAPKAYQKIEEQAGKAQQEMHDKLEKAAKEHAERIADIYKKISESFGETYSRLEQGNPFMSIETNAAKAAAAIQREFGAAGTKVVQQLQAIERQVADVERISARFESAVAANDLRQQARDIERTRANGGPIIGGGFFGGRYVEGSGRQGAPALSAAEQASLTNLREDLAVATRVLEQNRGINADASQRGFDKAAESAIKASGLEVQKLPAELQTMLRDIYNREADRQDQAEKRADERMQQEAKLNEQLLAETRKSAEALARNTQALLRDHQVNVNINGLSGNSTVSLAGPSSR